MVLNKVLIPEKAGSMGIRGNCVKRMLIFRKLLQLQL